MSRVVSSDNPVGIPAPISSVANASPFAGATSQWQAAGWRSALIVHAQSRLEQPTLNSRLIYPRPEQGHILEGLRNRRSAREFGDADFGVNDVQKLIERTQQSRIYRLALSSHWRLFLVALRLSGVARGAYEVCLDEAALAPIGEIAADFSDQVFSGSVRRDISKAAGLFAVAHSLGPILNSERPATDYVRMHIEGGALIQRLIWELHRGGAVSLPTQGLADEVINSALKLSGPIEGVVHALFFGNAPEPGGSNNGQA